MRDGARAMRESVQLTVFYDGACPGCVRDRRWYESLAGRTGEEVEWRDITGRDAELQALGIDSFLAMTELHVRDAHGVVHRELDAYILLMGRVWLLKPLAWLLALPWLRPWLSRRYHRHVQARLQREGRL